MTVPVWGSPTASASRLVQRHRHRLDVQTLFIEPGSPLESGYSEGFNGTYEYKPDNDFLWLASR